MSRASFRNASLAVSLAVASALAAAQNVSDDRRFTPVLGQGEPLYPQSPQSPAQPPRPLDAQPGAVDYRANKAVDRVVVEVDRNGVPADGQSGVRVVVQLFDANGQPLAGEAFATIEHSGGRLRLPGAATDELGPGRQDADRVTSGVQLPVRVDRVGLHELVVFAYGSELEDAVARTVLVEPGAGGDDGGVPPAPTRAIGTVTE